MKLDPIHQFEIKDFFPSALQESVEK